MNRQEFMKQLEMLLSDISQAEREEALQYYNDYLDDAGIENEEESIGSLGSPAQVAANIKEGLRDGIETGEFTEGGYHMNMEEEAPAAPESAEESEASGNNSDRIVLQLGDDFSEDTFAKRLMKRKLQKITLLIQWRQRTESRKLQEAGQTLSRIRDRILSGSRYRKQQTGSKTAVTRRISIRTPSIRGILVRAANTRGIPVRVLSTREIPIRVTSIRGIPAREASTREIPVRVLSTREIPIREPGTRETRAASTREIPIRVISRASLIREALILIIIRGLTAINIRIPITSIRARDPISISTRTNMVIPTIPITDLLKRDVRPVKSYCLFFYVFLPCRLSSR